jgi:hypothetical protein
MLEVIESFLRTCHVQAGLKALDTLALTAADRQGGGRSEAREASSTLSSKETRQCVSLAWRLLLFEVRAYLSTPTEI